jgi:hypothetical protein
MSEQEQERHFTDTIDETDEPDVEGHMQEAFREDAVQEREQTDAFDERHRTDEAI